jgi:hypothetical protein
MIRYLRQRIAIHRLNKLVARNLQSFEVQDYAKRRKSALKATRARAG